MSKINKVLVKTIIGMVNFCLFEGKAFVSVVSVW